MGSFRIASRYAKSLLQLAEEKNQLEQVYADMKNVDSILTASRDLRLVFKSPIIPPDKKLTITQKLFADKITPLLLQFLTLLIKKNREAYFHDIVSSFIEQYNAIKGITPVKLVTAVKLERAQVSEMINALKAKELLKEVELTEEVDESLIGGFLLKYGDKMLDDSIKRRLSELNVLIQDNSYVKKYS